MKLAFLQRHRRPTSVLGIALESGRLVVAHVRRDNGAARLHQALALDLTPEAIAEAPETAGRTLAAQLEAAGLREKRCVVCLPPSWALTASADLPAVSAEDLQTYLELQAEKDFPLPPSELQLSHSAYTLADGKSRATLAAVPTRRLEAVKAMLAAAGCEPVSISLGLRRCISPAPSSGSLNLLVNGNHVDVVVSAGGGIVDLRTLPLGTPGQKAAPELDAQALGRELRITLGRLPESLRSQIQEGRFLGLRSAVDPVRQAVESPLKRLGIERTTYVEPLKAEGDAVPTVEAHAAVAAAVHHLEGERGVFEFVHPRVTRLDALLARFQGQRNRRWLTIGVIAFALPVLTLLWRSNVESRLNSKWRAMKPVVAELEKLQNNIHFFRPWFDPSTRSLDILAATTAAFPEDGSVWVRSLEVKENQKVNCSGSARSNSAFMEVLDRLRKDPRVREVQVQQVRGQNPIQFTFSFVWHHGAQN